MTDSDFGPTYGALLHLGDSALPTLHGDFRLHRFHNFATRAPALAAVMGDVASAEPLLARVHSSCVTSEALGACDCDCAEQLAIALAEIARIGRGVVFYLCQEGRGAGFAAKARDRMLVQASGHTLTTFEAYESMGLAKDHRRYDEVPAMRRLLGIVAPLRLLSNNPEKIAALEAEGVSLESIQRLAQPTTPFNVHYLSAKRRSGHVLRCDDRVGAPASLPAPIASFEPRRLPGDPSTIELASYWLPVTAGGADPCWFRLHLVLDSQTGTDRVVLVHGSDGDEIPLVGVRSEALRDRFPLRGEGARAAWQSEVRRIACAGAAVVLFRSEEGDRESAGDLDLRLLARHLPAGRARPLGREDATLCAELRGHGIAAPPDAPA